MGCWWLRTPPEPTGHHGLKKLADQAKLRDWRQVGGPPARLDADGLIRVERVQKQAAHRTLMPSSSATKVRSSAIANSTLTLFSAENAPIKRRHLRPTAAFAYAEREACFTRRWRKRDASRSWRGIGDRLGVAPTTAMYVYRCEPSPSLAGRAARSSPRLASPASGSLSCASSTGSTSTSRPPRSMSATRRPQLESRGGHPAATRRRPDGIPRVAPPSRYARAGVSDRHRATQDEGQRPRTSDPAGPQTRERAPGAPRSAADPRPRRAAHLEADVHHLHAGGRLRRPVCPSASRPPPPSTHV
jgi:hypothetical protein